MNLLAALCTADLRPLMWVLLASAGLLGLFALINPKGFRKLSSEGSRWIDTQKLVALLDKRVDVDQKILPHSRLLGGMVVASVMVLGWLMVR